MLGARLARLLPTTPLADEHCHATITDENGDEDACGRPAAHWVIYDPETGDQRAWPVCYAHASESYSGSVADEWVEALTAASALLGDTAGQGQEAEGC